MIHFEPPHITGTTVQEKQEQIIRYLRTLVEQMNIAQSQKEE